MICYEGGKFPVINTNGFLCAFDLSTFLMISDVTYFTVICYEDSKFPVIESLHGFLCAFE